VTASVTEITAISASTERISSPRRHPTRKRITAHMRYLREWTKERILPDMRYLSVAVGLCAPGRVGPEKEVL